MAAGPFRWGCGATLGVLVAFVVFAVAGIAAALGGCGTCLWFASQVPEPSTSIDAPAGPPAPPTEPPEAAAEKEFERAAALSREGRYDLSAAALKDILLAYPETQAAEKARAILPSVEKKSVDAGQPEAAPAAPPAAPQPPPGPSRDGEPPQRPRLSLAGYMRVEPGMTYEEVVAIVGPPTQELSRVRTEGVPGVLPSIETVMFMWEGAWGANMNAMFQNGRLVSKAQFGLR